MPKTLSALLPGEASSFCPPRSPVRKAHWPAQGTVVPMELQARWPESPLAITPTPRFTLSESLLIPSGRRLWENKWEHLLRKALWKYL